MKHPVYTTICQPHFTRI